MVADGEILLSNFHPRTVSTRHAYVFNTESFRASFRLELTRHQWVFIQSFLLYGMLRQTKSCLQKTLPICQLFYPGRARPPKRTLSVSDVSGALRLPSARILTMTSSMVIYPKHRHQFDEGWYLKPVCRHPQQKG